MVPWRETKGVLSHENRRHPAAVVDEGRADDPCVVAQVELPLQSSYSMRPECGAPRHRYKYGGLCDIGV